MGHQQRRFSPGSILERYQEMLSGRLAAVMLKGGTLCQKRALAQHGFSKDRSLPLNHKTVRSPGPLR